MVCIPCFIIPVILFFWRWLIQPYFYKYFLKKDKDGKLVEKEPEFITKCENGVCTFMRKPQQLGAGDQTQNQSECTETTKEAHEKKDD